MKSMIHFYTRKRFLGLSLILWGAWNGMAQQVEEVYSTFDFGIGSIYFPTEDTGFAMGSKYLGPDDGYEGFVLKIVDVGQNWDIIDFPLIGAGSVYFF